MLGKYSQNGSNNKTAHLMVQMILQCL